MSACILKYLQPSQYASWLKKVDDPDWYEHRYRDSKDHAMASSIRELRDALSQRAELLEALKESLNLLLFAGLNEDCSTSEDARVGKMIRAAIAKAEGK